MVQKDLDETVIHTVQGTDSFVTLREWGGRNVAECLHAKLSALTVVSTGSDKIVVRQGKYSLWWCCNTTDVQRNDEKTKKNTFVREYGHTARRCLYEAISA